MDDHHNGQTEKRAGAKSAWMLWCAAILAVAAGSAYLYQWSQGMRGTDLLGFTTIWVAAPFAISLLMMFSYFNKQKK